MSDIWMGIAPERKATRVIAMTGPSETILKARLLPSPTHSRAMATLLEAVAMGQGTKLRAVVSVADGDGACAYEFFSRRALMHPTAPPTNRTRTRYRGRRSTPPPP